MMHAQYFALINLKMKLHIWTKASLSPPSKSPCWGLDRQRDAPPCYKDIGARIWSRDIIMMRLLIARRYAACVWIQGQRWRCLSQSGSSSYSRKQVQYIDVISLVLRQNITSFLDLTDETCWLVIHFGNRAATAAPPAPRATSVIISGIL